MTSGAGTSRRERRIRRYTALVWIPLIAAGIAVAVTLNTPRDWSEDLLPAWFTWGIVSVLGAWLIGLPFVYQWPRSRSPAHVWESVGVLSAEAALGVLIGGGQLSVGLACWIALPTLILSMCLLTLTFYAGRKCSAWSDLCYGCGYSLIGLSEPRCSECGERVGRRRMRRLGRLASPEEPG